MRKVLLLGSMLLGACATVKSKVDNNPLAGGPSGKKVSVRVVGKDGKPLTAPIANVAKDEAQNWLVQKGFQFESNPRKIHSDLVLVLSEETKSVHIPASTYSTPIYDTSQPKSYTVNTTTNTGYSAKSTITESNNNIFPQVTGYQQHYVGAHNLNVTSQSIHIYITRFEHGKAPVELARGYAYHSDPNSVHSLVLEDEKRVRSAVKKLLAQSALNVESGARIVANSGDPGCWPRLGFDYAENGTVNAMADRGPASTAGLKKGDSLVEISGISFEQWKTSRPEFYEGQKVVMKISRSGKEIELKASAKNLCVDD